MIARVIHSEMTRSRGAEADAPATFSESARGLLAGRLPFPTSGIGRSDLPNLNRRVCPLSGHCGHKLLGRADCLRRYLPNSDISRRFLPRRTPPTRSRPAIVTLRSWALG